MRPLLRFLDGVMCSFLVIGLFLLSCDLNNSPTGQDESSKFGTVNGRIFYEGGSDFSGIIVTLERIIDNETGIVTAAKYAISAGDKAGKLAVVESDVLMTMTDKDGRYEFTGVSPGDYSFQAQKTSSHLAKVARISVTAAEPVIMDIVLTATANIVGTVKLDGLEDYSGVLVYVSGMSYMAMTDSDGSYTISDVPLGVYEFVVNARDYDVAKTTVKLDTAGVDAEIPLIILSKNGSIIGRVTDAVSGAVLENVTVSTLSGQKDTTNSSGIFSLENVPAGSSRLRLFLNDYDVLWVDVASIKSGELTTLPNDIMLYAEGTTPSIEQDDMLVALEQLKSSIEGGFSLINAAIFDVKWRNDLNMFLKLNINGNDIRGNYLAEGEHAEWINIYGFHHEIITPREEASGLLTGRRQHSQLKITKLIDRTTPLLYKALTENETVVSARLDFMRPDPSDTGTWQQYYTIELENGYIAGITNQSIGIMVDGKYKYLDMEEISFTYQTITWTYQDGGITAFDSWVGDD
ncbi:type VI secretion system tube protein TssD [Candidatus Latescibacterota bacterium]